MRGLTLIVLLGLVLPGLVNKEVSAQNDEAPRKKPAALARSSKLVAFEIMLIDRSAAELEGEQNKVPTPEQLLLLEKQGKLGSAQRLKLTALENVEARLQLGEEAPMVVSRNRSGREGFNSGFAGESVTYVSLGTVVTVTASVDDDGKIVAALTLQRTSLAPHKPAEKTEGQETASSYSRKLTSTVQTTTRLASGETALISGQQTLTGSTPSELWVLLTAKVQ